MDASVVQHLKEAKHEMEISFGSFHTQKGIDHLISAITIQERNISALESSLQDILKKEGKE